MGTALGLALSPCFQSAVSGSILDRLGVSASAAYSTRKLRTAYTGSAIRVRRSQDNAEQDIGFNVGNELDTTALTSFVGSENVFLRSEEFDNAAWVKSGITVAPNTSVDPLGGSTADTCTVSSGGTTFIYQLITTAGIKTQSIYAKQGTNRYLWMYGGVTGSNYGALFDLQTGVVTTTNTNGTPTSTANSIQDVGNGWFRCSITYLATSNVYQAFTSTNNAVPTFSANNDITNTTTGDILIWGAQLQNSASLKPYQPTTTTAINGGEGFVTTWYDQSGLGNNQTNATALTQPKIVVGGVVNLSGTKPALSFTLAGSEVLFNGAMTNLASNTDFFIGSVFEMLQASQSYDMVAGFRNAVNNSTAGALVLQGASTFTQIGVHHTDIAATLIKVDVTTRLARRIATVGRTGGTNGNNGTVTVTATGNSQPSYVTTGTQTWVSTTTSGFQIGGRQQSGTVFGNKNISEVVLFNTNLTTDQRRLLELNQGEFYTITVPSS